MTELQQLLTFAHQTPELRGGLVLVLDENSGSLPRAPAGSALAIGNRLDAHRAAEAAGWRSTFSDFDFSGLALESLACGCYRISKEKRVVEHVLQSLWQALPVGGQLCMAGYKNEGIKTFAKRLQAASACEVELQRGEQQLHLYRLRKTRVPFTPLNEGDYHALQNIGSWQGRDILSKPGVFAWDRFDAGSLFLLEQLALLRRDRPPPQSGLDLGCGNGLLAVALLAFGCPRVVATDNNAAALLACRHNLAAHAGESTVEVVAADCADGITTKVELVLCNPPFHQGFAVESSLTGRFLQAARRLLAPGGEALFVVNSFIPLEREATGIFGRVEVVADNRRYKVIRLA